MVASDPRAFGETLRVSNLTQMRYGGGKSKMQIDRFPAIMREPLCLFRDDKPLKAHPAYRAAKAGDVGRSTSSKILLVC